MGNNKMTILVSLAVVFAMAVPVYAVINYDSNIEAAVPADYALVTFDASGQENYLREIGANIVSLNEWGAYVKVTESQKDIISGKMSIAEMPERTTMNLLEQGIVFDTKVGHDAPSELMKVDTEHYLVQFVTPGTADWYDGIDAVTAGVQRHVNDNAIVVKMDAAQKAVVEDLDYVEWIGAYEPAFKIDAKLQDKIGPIHITVDTYSGTDIPTLMATLSSMGAWEVEDSNYGPVLCWIDSSQLSEVAALESASLIWHLPEMKTTNNVGGRISRAWDLWDNSISNLPMNIMGEGQIVHVQDTGIDATHPDFLLGPLGDRLLYSDTTTDTKAHGTHVAGTVGGNGYQMEQYLGLSTANRVYNELAAANPVNMPDRAGFAGRAPECTIYFRDGLVTTEWAAGYTAGARILTNSWGPKTLTPGYKSDADIFMNSNPGALVLFSAGNDGPRTMTVNGNGNGKLVISVGALENMRPIQSDGSDDYGQVASFSSRGPVGIGDDRIKPDIVEVGTAVYSTKSDDASETDKAGLYDKENLIDMDGNSRADYYQARGTSMSCPAVAGDSALIRQYLVDVRSIATPHANLIKNLLIHGAVDIGLGYPSYDQGWGRANVRNSICPPAPNVLQWYHHAGIGAGNWDASAEFDLTVLDESVPLKITMSHWDSTSSGTLTTDYDIVAVAPNGVRYEGNAFQEAWSTPIAVPGDWANAKFPSWVGGEDYDFDTADDGGDDVNNVEIIRVEQPRAGTWDVHVYWKSGSSQPFDVAITGGMDLSSDVNSASNVYRVNMQLDTPRIVPERDDFGEAIFKAAQSGSVMVPYWINNGGTTNDVYAITEPTLPAGFTAAYFPSSPVSINSNSRVHGYARINVGAAVSVGTYTLRLKATSINDGSSPIAESIIAFQVDVVDTKTPPTWKVADSSAHEDAPSMVSWNSGGIDYIACTYRQDARYGDKVYFTLSSNGGRNWSVPIPISQDSWSPDYLTIERATSGQYEGRIMIAYEAWNPDGYLLSTSDLRCSYVKIHWADSPYTNWTMVDVFTNGEGMKPGGANKYRTINCNWVPSTEEFYMTVEDMGYTGTNLGDDGVEMDRVYCIGRASADGGVTWGGMTQIDPNDPTKYYFFPNVETDNLGNLVLYYYQRDSDDAAQDRDATFQYYTGVWGTIKSAWDTSDNLMMPQTTVAAQGANNNRAYGSYIKGANSNGDRELHLIWTDDAGTSFDTNSGAGYGPYGPVISDHDMGSRFLCDLLYTPDNYVWVFAHRHSKYDIYGQPNMFAVYDDNYAGGVAPVVDYMTLDSFVHGKQRAENIDEGSGKIFLATNTFTKEGGHDIIGMHVYNGWKSEADTLGPVTEYVSTDKVIMSPGESVVVVANCHEWQTGGNWIAGAQYKTDFNLSVIFSMESMDGDLNSPAEAVKSSTPIDTTGWAGGWHKIWVRGQDNLTNWGAWTETQIFIDATRRPDEPVNPNPENNEMDVPVSKVFSVYVDDYESNDMNVDFYWQGDPIPFAELTNIPSRTTATTGAIALTGDTIYNWYAIATDGTGSTQSESWRFTTEDNVPPATPTLNMVYRGGPGDSTVTETRYMRDTTLDVNGLDTYELGTAISSNGVRSSSTGNMGTVFTGFRAWIRNSGGTETEITGGVIEAMVFRTSNGAGIQTSTWSCPSTTMLKTDSIVIRVYQSLVAPPTNLKEEFTTPQLGATNLDANTWTLNYYTSRGIANDYFYFGDSTWNSTIDGFKWSIDSTPTDHNTLNWTKSADDGAGTNDVDHYNIYRSNVEAGPWNAGNLIGNVGSGVETYVDSDRGAADSTLWWYVVRAVDMLGNEDTNTNAVIESVGGPEGYGIEMNSYSAGNWAFVSFPYPMSGNIETILDDSVLGDGGTTWDVARWYDPQNTADPWKTYRAGALTNDLTTIDNTMGVWVHLTANGGDQKLTTSVASDYSGSNVDISLYTGWNLVSYPSATARLASTTLPGAAGMVAYYNSGAPYLVTEALPTAVTFSEGNAYWVHVSSDATWSVAP